MATLTVSGTLSFPLAAEATPPSRTFSFSLIYTQKNQDELDYAAPVADDDIMGKIADAKFFMIECTLGDGTLKINGASETIPLKVNSGWYMFANADGGLTACLLSCSVASKFRLYAFA